MAPTLLPAGPESTSVDLAADRLARLLSHGGGTLADPTGSQLEFEAEIRPRPLELGSAPADAWAVDGGQALVADARCLQLVVTRASRVRFCNGSCVLEDEGELRAHLLGSGDANPLAGALGGAIAADAHIDVNLLRDAGEWEAALTCIDEADPGAVVLIDGDLQPDARIPPAFLSRVLAHAEERQVVPVAVTKHSSLARGRAPLIGLLEREVAEAIGPRARWWAPVARGLGEGGREVQVVAARLDPDARFAFRVDLPAWADAGSVLGQVAALSDDAAFPGYPYPLTVADRLAACPSWLRHDVWLQVDDRLDRAGVPADVRERAFTDRHALMERF